MGTFNKVTKESLDSIQINAGMILNTFNPSAPKAPAKGEVVCATTGGITANCTPSFEDFGADIDNCPNNTMEMKKSPDGIAHFHSRHWISTLKQSSSVLELRLT